MIKRKSFKACCKNNKIDELKHKVCEFSMEVMGIEALSLFHYENDLYLYYEYEVEDASVYELLKGVEEFLIPWGGNSEIRYWFPMMNIFHYNKPQPGELWRDSHALRRPWGRLARLKEEMVSSYIYYHYQYQEERPGDGDKYGIISIHENLIFFYLELPEYIEKANYKGLLKSKNTPDNWVEVMDPHFILWQDVPEEMEIWRDLELMYESRLKP